MVSAGHLLGVPCPGPVTVGNRLFSDAACACWWVGWGLLQRPVWSRGEAWRKTKKPQPWTPPVPRSLWSPRPFVLAGCVAGLMRPGPVPFPAAHKWACASGSWLSYSHGWQCTHSSLVCLWVSCPLACSPDTLQDGASPRAGPVPDSSLDPGMGPGRSKPWFRVDQSQGTSS